ncbi:MarR family transcriptional regulator [Actinocatenispora sera]|uniref:MarR family winged helix-turn-helix transcriptional regulator n=1 Tax=Actinocatenispora sera TaxID=390989 RepID=UPI0033C7B0A8
MMSERRRARQREDLLAMMRENASRAVILHQTIAERFGLNSTDIKCLDLARDEPALTAGRLAELTGMSTSAITAVLDRLERRGFVERRRDPADRRKVIVVATGEHVRRNAEVFARLAAEIGAVLDDYDEEQLATFLAIGRRVNAAARAFTGTLTREKDHPDDDAAGRPRRG